MSLFGELADRFVTQRENLASDALAYLIEHYPAARMAVSELVREAAPAAVGALAFERESRGEDGGRPDLAVRAGDGSECALIEVKFCAGLTEQQPAGYLRWLAAIPGAALIFVAPERRVVTLWSELSIAMRDHEIEVVPTESAYRANVSAGQSIGVVSWPLVLRRIGAAVVGDTAVESDLHQLVGLTERAEGEAFYPLTSSDLSPEVPMRQQQYYALLFDLIKLLTDRGFVDVEQRIITPGLANGMWFGQNILIADIGFWIGVWYEPWRQLRTTPFWLQLRDDDPADRAHVLAALGIRRTAAPPRLLSLYGDDVIPLEVATGVGREPLLESLVAQVAEVRTLLLAAPRP